MTLTAHLHCADALEFLRAQPDKSCDLVFTSPPYALKGERYSSTGEADAHPWEASVWAQWCQDWILEACRVSRGRVGVVVCSPNKSGGYIPAAEAVMFMLSGRVFVDRPCIWVKNAANAPRDWFRNAWEYILWFRALDVTEPYFDWEAVANPPLYSAGGGYRQRTTNGIRKEGNPYPDRTRFVRPSDIAWDPSSDTTYVTVGGGHMGHKLAHDNEAPFPLRLVLPFVHALSPAWGTVVDPFMGSGTVGHACLLAGRKFVGADLRASQVDLTCSRLLDVIEVSRIDATINANTRLGAAS
jgi:DNA modification methylase